MKSFLCSIFLIFLFECAGQFQKDTRLYYVIGTKGNIIYSKTKEVIRCHQWFSANDTLLIPDNAYLALMPMIGPMREYTKAGPLVLPKIKPDTSYRTNNKQLEFSDLESNATEEPIEANYTKLLSHLIKENATFEGLLSYQHIDFSLDSIVLYTNFKDPKINTFVFQNYFDEPLLTKKEKSTRIILKRSELPTYDTRLKLLIENRTSCTGNLNYDLKLLPDVNPYFKKTRPYTAADYFFLGNYFSSTGNFVQAVSCFEFAVQLQPEVRNYRDYLIDCYFDFLGTPHRRNKPFIGGSVERKPVIYLYPETEIPVSVNLEYPGKLDFTFPEYHNGWKILAKPTGELLNLADSSLHYFLFWEGKSWRPKPAVLGQGKGFCVEGKNAARFLLQMLPQIGLTPKEYNDFVVYWTPFLQKNQYNKVYFALNQEYDQFVSKLQVSPAPESSLRVFMFVEALEQPVSLTPQQFIPFERKGFTLVEWGGTEWEEENK